MVKTAEIKESIEKDQSTVTQDNMLISATYSMRLDVKRLLVLAVSKIDPMSKAWLNGEEITITSKEWATAFNIDIKPAYQRLKKASDDLYNRSVTIAKGDWGRERIRWLSREKYKNQEGCVIINFAPEMTRYLSGFVDEFTSYKLLSVSGLKSVHSIRMYELAKQFVETGWRYITLDQLRETFELGESYKLWSHIKLRIVDRACQEVSLKSDLKLSYEVIKRSRSVHAIQLKVERKTQMDLGI